MGLVFLLSTCSGRSNPPTPFHTPTPTQIYSECDPDLLVSPSLVSPNDESITSNLTPMFEWAYPGYTIADESFPDDKQLCSTEGFNIYLSSGPYFADYLGGPVGGVPAMDSFYTKIWTPGTSLEPGRQYRWFVRAVSQDVEGPSSEMRTFFTGPMCDAENLSAPEPLSPLNHWVVDDLGELLLTWWYPDACLPDSYGVELAPLLLFDGSPLNGSTGTPAMSWTPAATLEDCERYFWRVTAFKDGMESPASQVLTFRVDLTGSCAPEAIGMIRGTVWEDECAAFGAVPPFPDPLPYGCVPTAGDTMFTNQTYDPGEPGIPGLVVSLAQGACPSSTILRAVPTWGGGMYDFYMVSPGTYCVSVDTDFAWNNFIQPGTWTFPADAIGETLANQTVTVTAGQKSNVDFGWWYEFGSGWGSSNASVFGMVWHDLCAYAPGDPVPDPLPAGCALDEWGNVHADAERQAGEPGIPGVVVDIGPGPCPSAGLATSVTDASGYYHFSDLPAGDYCLRIDPDHGSSNEAILLPGSWTVIPSGHEGMTFRAITLTAATTLAGQDFGWDYDNLPISSLGPEPLFTLEFNANCRKGPSLLHEVSTFGLAGQSFHILGRNEENNWFLVRFNEILQCWFARNAGSTSADTSRLQVFTGPPLLTCSDHKDESSCMADTACEWENYSTTIGGYCKSK